MKNILVLLAFAACFVPGLAQDAADPGLFTSLKAALAHPDKVTELDLSGQKDLDFPPEMATLRKLEVLNLDDCRLEKVPGFIRKLPQLVDLSLADNQLSKVPGWLAKVPALESIDLRGNEFSESTSLGIRERLEHISVFLD